jgi:hypothetical protein
MSTAVSVAAPSTEIIHRSEDAARGCGRMAARPASARAEGDRANQRRTRRAGL